MTHVTNTNITSYNTTRGRHNPSGIFNLRPKFLAIHILQVLTDLIIPLVFENFNNPLLQINNNPKFGKIACICFIAFIPNDTQSNIENFFKQKKNDDSDLALGANIELLTVLNCFNAMEKVSPQVLWLLQAHTVRQHESFKWKVSQPEFWGFGKTNFTTPHFPGVLPNTHTSLEDKPVYSFNGSHLCNTTATRHRACIPANLTNIPLSPNFHATYSKLPIVKLPNTTHNNIYNTLTDTLYYTLDGDPYTWANVSWSKGNYKFPVFLPKRTTPMYNLTGGCVSHLQFVGFKLPYLLQTHQTYASSFNCLRTNPYSYGPFPINSWTNFSIPFKFTTGNSVDTANSPSDSTTYIYQYPKTVIRPNIISNPDLRHHSFLNIQDDLVNLTYNISYGLKPIAWFYNFGANINPTNTHRLSGTLLQGYQ